jgi:hypothetical protein
LKVDLNDITKEVLLCVIQKKFKGHEFDLSKRGIKATLYIFITINEQKEKHCNPSYTKHFWSAFAAYTFSLIAFTLIIQAKQKTTVNVIVLDTTKKKMGTTHIHTRGASTAKNPAW